MNVFGKGELPKNVNRQLSIMGTCGPCTELVLILRDNRGVTRGRERRRWGTGIVLITRAVGGVSLH